MPNSIRFGRSGNSFLERSTNLPPITSFTVMAWVMPRDVTTTSDQIIWSFGTQSTDVAYELFIDGASHRLGIWNGTASQLGAAAALTANVWSHMAITVNGSSGTNFLCYINGVLDNSFTATAVVAGTLSLGSQSALAELFNGNIAGLKIWNRALSQAEIAAEMSATQAVSRAGLNTEISQPNSWEALVDSPYMTPDRGAATSRFIDYSGNCYQWTTETGTIDVEPGPPARWAPPRYRVTYVGATPAGAGGGITASSTSAIAIGGSATASVAVDASSTRTVAIGGSSTASIGVNATSNTSVGIAGSAAGSVAVNAQSVAPVGVSGSSTASVAIGATSVIAIQLGGSSTGVVRVNADSARLIAVGGSASGVVGAVPISADSARAIAIGGSASGRVDVNATSNAVVALVAIASGVVQVTGQSNIALVVAALGAASVGVVAQSSLRIPIGGSATASQPSSARGAFDASFRVLSRLAGTPVVTSRLTALIRVVARLDGHVAVYPVH
jgi:hypothetical protein